MLIEALRDPARVAPWCKQVRILETHISWVLLTGRYAFKIKKPVNLGFLDFTSLAARRFYCEREVELNRRTAPGVYLGVVPIAGTAEDPRVEGDGPPIEYAVKMREFPQEALLSWRLDHGALTAAEIDALAETVARFHAGAARVDAGAAFGSAAEVLALALENFTEIEPLLATSAERTELAALRAWTVSEHRAKRAAFDARRRDGFVRACHGDLHLGNIALVDGRVTPFDCIEFNEHLRWSDVMADVGFLVMDLEDRGRADLAARALNGYLEFGGDYAGLPVLRFYVVYRAAVRAKVARMRAAQAADTAVRDASLADYRGYLALAARAGQPGPLAVVITHGPAASGKTTAAQQLVDAFGAIRVRTDVERKRLHGLPPHARSGSALDAGLYTAPATEATYERVAALVRTVVDAGHVAVADGAFLRRGHRDRFRSLAASLGVPFMILDCVADEAVLHERIAVRRGAGRDASEADAAVLARQLRSADPLSDDERATVITWRSTASRAVDLVHEVRARLHLGKLDAGILRGFCE